MARYHSTRPNSQLRPGRRVRTLKNGQPHTGLLLSIRPSTTVVGQPMLYRVRCDHDQRVHQFTRREIEEL